MNYFKHFELLKDIHNYLYSSVFIINFIEILVIKIKDFGILAIIKIIDPNFSVMSTN